jgi:hypothetical protein
VRFVRRIGADPRRIVSRVTVGIGPERRRVVAVGVEMEESTVRPLPLPLLPAQRRRDARRS